MPADADVHGMAVLAGLALTGRSEDGTAVGDTDSRESGPIHCAETTH